MEAIRAGDDVVTYGHLAALVSAIASRLQAGPFRRGSGFVGILATNRIRMTAAMFGTLAAGRAFVLLDPDDPPDRLAFILEDAAVGVVLADGAHAATAAAVVPAECRVVDLEAIPMSGVVAEVLPVSSDMLAYVCYTSGSTGRPKGVLQTQANLLHFARVYAAMLGIAPGDRASLVYAPGFSALFMDVFGVLLHGATLCAYDMRRDGVDGLAAWIERERISILHMVPTVFRRLCASLPAGHVLADVRAIDLGGESVSAGDARLVARHFSPRCGCWNHLAATEASVIARHRLRPGADEEGSGLLPVGTPPPGVCVWIEDDAGTPVGPGASGRLAVSSPHVSPGYWRQPHLDARHFAPDPDRPGWRVYRGDDRAHIDVDGVLHFDGRDGGRVKLRGHSVDVSEVEAAVLACPGVREAAIIAEVNDVGEAIRLDAHVATTGSGADVAALRAAFIRRLPSYMVPAMIHVHDALPQTPSGKVDRRALSDVWRRGSARTPPATAREREIAKIFAAVLGQEAVGRETDFFDAGGDSLATVDLLARLSRAAGREVGHGTLLQHPTVSALATAIDRLPAGAVSSTTADAVLVPLRTTGRLPPLFLVHGRLGQAHASRHLLDALGEEQPLYGIQARGLHGGHPPHATVRAMADDYVAAMRTIRPRGPYFIGGLCMGSYVAMAMAERLRRDGDEVLPLLLFDPKPPGPRWRRWLPRRRDGGEREWIEHKLRVRCAQGRISGHGDAAPGVVAATDVALAFQHAFRSHAFRPYDGPVCLLASRERLVAWQRGTAARRVFRGPIHMVEAGPTHEDMFDPRNPLFVSQLSRCLARIHALFVPHRRDAA